MDGTVVATAQRMVPPERRRVGIVFQEPALFPHLTVFGNVGFGLDRMDRSERERTVLDLICMAGIGDLGDRYPHEISGGQAQRVALARALAPSPRLLLLDESFNNLDASLKGRLVADVRELLQATKTTAILVTHDRGEAFAFADRMAVMDGGRLLQVGEPRALYGRPDAPEVAWALGAVNLVSHWEPSQPLNGHGRRLADGRLMIRPDRLEIVAREDQGFKDHSDSVGFVSRTVFRGEYQEVWVTGLAREDVMVHAPPAQRWREGDAVRVRLREPRD
jgi:iron(III) transport system ATP-binding protein